jgi:hypothetical protein
MFQFSRRLALVFGVALPVLETIRRLPQLADFGHWPLWIDDLLLGAALLLGASMTSGLRYQNARYLAAAWGAACGMGYYSFIASCNISMWRIRRPFLRRGSQSSKASA